MEIETTILENGNLTIKIHDNVFPLDQEKNECEISNEILEELKIEDQLRLMQENERFDLIAAPILTDIYDYDNETKNKDWENYSWIYIDFYWKNWMHELLNGHEIEFIVRKNL